MKCDDCLNLLEEYIDGEVVAPEAEQISAHLITCAQCANEFEALTAEQEIYARYDRELEVSPAMWNVIAARTAAERRAVDKGSQTNLGEWFVGLFALPRWGYAFSGALAVSMVAIVLGVMYLRIQPQPPQYQQLVKNDKAVVTPTVTSGNEATGRIPSVSSTSPVELPVELVASRKKMPKQTGHPKADDPGVLFADVAYSDLAERDTAEHIQQAENLLRSIRSLQAADDDGEIDVSYEKAMSQRLLSENQELRKDAERAGKFPTKELLADLEPFLVDIANLPDKATPDKLRAIKDRAQKTEIVAALVGY